MAKKNSTELPKLVTVEKELLEQVLMIVGGMPIMDAQKAVKAAHDGMWDHKKDEKLKVIPLSLLNGLGGYIRILPLYQVGELYTMLQMGVKVYGAEENLTAVKKTKESTIVDDAPERPQPEMKVTRTKKTEDATI